MQHVEWSVFSPWLLLPVKYSIWHLPEQTEELKTASKNYLDAVLVVTRQYLGFLGKQNPPQGQRIAEAESPQQDAKDLEDQKNAQRAELRALGLKSLYWALITLGSGAILVATCISLFSDYNP